MNYSIKDIFLQRLRAELSKRKLTVKKFSEEIGVNEATVYNWLYMEKATPRAATLVDIALYLNVSTDYLLGMDHWRKNNEQGNS